MHQTLTWNSQSVDLLSPSVQDQGGMWSETNPLWFGTSSGHDHKNTAKLTKSVLAVGVVSSCNRTFLMCKKTHFWECMLDGWDRCLYGTCVRGCVCVCVCVCLCVWPWLFVIICVPVCVLECGYAWELCVYVCVCRFFCVAAGVWTQAMVCCMHVVWVHTWSESPFIALWLQCLDAAACASTSSRTSVDRYGPTLWLVPTLTTRGFSHRQGSAVPPNTDLCELG